MGELRLSLDDDLHKALKLASVKLDMTYSDLFTEALTFYLNNNQEAKTKNDNQTIVLNIEKSVKKIRSSTHDNEIKTINRVLNNKILSPIQKGYLKEAYQRLRQAYSFDQSIPQEQKIDMVNCLERVSEVIFETIKETKEVHANFSQKLETTMAGRNLSANSSLQHLPALNTHWFTTSEMNQNNKCAAVEGGPDHFSSLSAKNIRGVLK